MVHRGREVTIVVTFGSHRWLVATAARAQGSRLMSQETRSGFRL